MKEQQTTAAVQETAAEQEPQDGQTQPVAQTENNGPDAQQPWEKKTETAQEETTEQTPREQKPLEDFKLPEGFEPNREDMDEFKTLAGKMNLTQEAAQQLVDFEALRVQKMAQAWAEKSEESYLSQVKDWEKQTKERLGPDYKKKMAGVHTVLEKYATPEFKKLLLAPAKGGEGGLGWGNHPEVVQTFVNISAAFADDEFVDGPRAGAATPKTAGEIMYPSMAKK